MKRLPLLVCFAVLIVALASAEVGSAGGSQTVYLPLVVKSEVPTAQPTSTTAVPTASPTSQPQPTATSTLPPYYGDPAIDAIDGSGYIYSNDGEHYLGLVSSNCYASESIVNNYGTYGSPYGTYSIRNEYGTYGSPYSSQSANNPYTSTPPVVWRYYAGAWHAYAYVTENQFRTPRLDTSYLIAYLQWKGGCSD